MARTCLGAEEINQPAPGSWVGKVQPSNSGSACIDPDTRPAVLPQLHLRPRAEPDQALSRLLRDRRAAVDLQLELQLAAGEGDQALQGQDLHRRQLHLVARPDQRPGRLLRVHPEHLQRQRRLRPRRRRPQQRPQHRRGLGTAVVSRTEGLEGPAARRMGAVRHLRDRLRASADNFGKQRLLAFLQSAWQRAKRL